MRYAMLVAAAAGAVLGAMNLGVNLGAGHANVMLVDAGHVLPQANAHLWVLGLVAGLVTLSLCRFAIFGLPSMMDGWYREHKSWLVTAGGGGLIYGVLYLM